MAGDDSRQVVVTLDAFWNVIGRNFDPGLDPEQLILLHRSGSTVFAERPDGTAYPTDRAVMDEFISSEGHLLSFQVTGRWLDSAGIRQDFITYEKAAGILAALTEAHVAGLRQKADALETLVHKVYPVMGDGIAWLSDAPPVDPGEAVPLARAYPLGTRMVTAQSRLFSPIDMWTDREIENAVTYTSIVVRHATNGNEWPNQRVLLLEDGRGARSWVERYRIGVAPGRICSLDEFKEMVRTARAEKASRLGRERARIDCQIADLEKRAQAQAVA